MTTTMKKYFCGLAGLFAVCDPNATSLETALAVTLATGVVLMALWDLEV
jgi:hypothetical protein